MSWAFLVGLIPTALSCAVLYVAVALAVRLVAGPRAVRAYVLASAPVIAALCLGVVAFETLAFRMRTVPSPGGVMGERQGSDLRQYLLVARLGFSLLYASALVWAVRLGLRHRHSARREGSAGERRIRSSPARAHGAHDTACRVLQCLSSRHPFRDGDYLLAGASTERSASIVPSDACRNDRRAGSPCPLRIHQSGYPGQPR